MTKIQSPYEKARVECPKKTGKMDNEDSCRACEHYSKCWSAILGVL